MLNLGDCGSHSKRFSACFLKYWSTVSWLIASEFASRICWYAYIYLAATQPQIMRDPSPWLTCGKVFFSLSAATFFSKETFNDFWPKHSIFTSSACSMCIQHASGLVYKLFCINQTFTSVMKLFTTGMVTNLLHMSFLYFIKYKVNVHYHVQKELVFNSLLQRLFMSFHFKTLVYLGCSTFSQ